MEDGTCVFGIHFHHRMPHTITFLFDSFYISIFDCCSDFRILFFACEYAMLIDAKREIFWTHFSIKYAIRSLFCSKAHETKNKEKNLFSPQNNNGENACFWTKQKQTSHSCEISIEIKCICKANDVCWTNQNTENVKPSIKNTTGSQGIHFLADDTFVFFCCCCYYCVRNPHFPFSHTARNNNNNESDRIWFYYHRRIYSRARKQRVEADPFNSL